MQELKIMRNKMSEDIKLGLHNISNEEYHSSPGLSRSALMQFKKSPYHYWHSYLKPDKTRQTPSEAMVLGELVHTLVLEPLSFQDRYIMTEHIDRRTKAGKEHYASVLENAKEKGVTVINSDLYARAYEMRQSLQNNPEINSVLSKQELNIEKSIYFKDERADVLCKARPDGFNCNFALDLKTSRDASYNAFQRQAVSSGYYLQAGMIKIALKSIGCDIDNFIFIVVENREPYATATYIMHQEALEYGMNQFYELVANYKLCSEMNRWPGYAAKELTVPRFAMYDEIDDIDIDIEQ